MFGSGTNAILNYPSVSEWLDSELIQYNTLYYTPTRFTGIGEAYKIYIDRNLHRGCNTEGIDNRVNLQVDKHFP